MKSTGKPADKENRKWISKQCVIVFGNTEEEKKISTFNAKNSQSKLKKWDPHWLDSGWVNTSQGLEFCQIAFFILFSHFLKDTEGTKEPEPKNVRLDLISLLSFLFLLKDKWLYPTPLYNFGKNRTNTCRVSGSEDGMMSSLSSPVFPLKRFILLTKHCTF